MAYIVNQINKGARANRLYKVGNSRAEKLTFDTQFIGEGQLFPMADYGEFMHNATLNAQTGTTYTLQLSDDGSVITMNNSSANTVTFPAGLGAGFNCLIIQTGAGQTTVAAETGTTINSVDGLKISARYRSASLLAYAADTAVLSGGLTT